MVIIHKTGIFPRISSLPGPYLARDRMDPLCKSHSFNKNDHKFKVINDDNISLANFSDNLNTLKITFDKNIQGNLPCNKIFDENSTELIAGEKRLKSAYSLSLFLFPSLCYVRNSFLYVTSGIFDPLTQPYIHLLVSL